MTDLISLAVAEIAVIVMMSLPCCFFIEKIYNLD